MILAPVQCHRTSTRPSWAFPLNSGCSSCCLLIQTLGVLQAQGETGLPEKARPGVPKIPFEDAQVGSQIICFLTDHLVFVTLDLLFVLVTLSVSQSLTHGKTNEHEMESFR